MNRHLGARTLAVIASLVLCSCAGRVMQYDQSEKIFNNDEYDKKIVVKEEPAKATEPPTPQVKPAKAAGKKKKKKESVKVADKKKKGPRQPVIEDSVGFEGRRPIKDPFRVGEKVVLSLSYFNIVAGTLELAVLPMVEVNGQKAYHFQVKAVSNSLFNRVYAVDDTAVTYMSYEDLIPLNLSITLKESKQLAETRTFIDWKTNKATYWQKKVTKEHGEESKRKDWDVLPYSQNVISAVFYMRTFSYEVDKGYEFRVADEGKNIVFKGEIIRKEKLHTDIGDFDTIVMKPKLTVDGAFAPVGEILIWMTDDDRKLIVRIESKIKIGSLVAKLKSIDKGQE
jgi:hypothetical protein